MLERNRKKYFLLFVVNRVELWQTESFTKFKKKMSLIWYNFTSFFDYFFWIIKLVLSVMRNYRILFHKEFDMLEFHKFVDNFFIKFSIFFFQCCYITNSFFPNNNLKLHLHKLTIWQDLFFKWVVWNAYWYISRVLEDNQLIINLTGFSCLFSAAKVWELFHTVTTFAIIWPDL